MGLFACISERDGTIAHVREYDDALIAAMAPAKRQWYRPVVVDPQPSVTATQTAERQPNIALWVIEPTQVRVPWVVRDLTQPELDAQADAAELAVLQQVAAALKAGTGTAAERLVRLERVAVWLLKQAAKRGVV